MMSYDVDGRSTLVMSYTVIGGGLAVASQLDLASSLKSTPDTGYGTPQAPNNSMYIVGVLAVVIIATGLVLLYLEKRKK